ncbi:hypothetical protein [Nocardioides sambongensis]|uniref:hypothetical protein n=1 Tax=Nocardioides sambongensis TaxID=2589074 RepID=UPI00112CC733|nr:hypothetical protein [Nocardioides sambongensis]
MVQETKTVYRRGEGAAHYFSSKESKPDPKELDDLAGYARLFDQAAYENAVAKLHAEHDNGEAQAHSIDVLRLVTKRYEFLSPKARETRNAQVDMVVALLNDDPAPLTPEDEAFPEDKRYTSALDKHLQQVQRATGESWGKLYDWCAVPAKGPGQKKTGELRVPSQVAREIERRKEAASAKAPGRRSSGASS